MKLASFLNPALIFCELAGETREEIYRNMLTQAQGQLREKIDVGQVAGAMIAREDNLRIPYDGVALPHLRLAELRDLYIIIGIPKTPLMLKSDDSKATSIIIMSLISESTSGSYLKALAAFSRYLAQEGNIARVTSCKDGIEVISKLADDNVLINKTLTAEDLMLPCPVVHMDDSLAGALDIFYREWREVLPVVDSENHLLGQISSLEIIKSFIPDYVFMMENLNFMTSFEVFENIFKSENKHTVKEYLHPVNMTLAPNTPLIQFTIRLVRREARVGFVVDEENRLMGVVGINNIVYKVLRG